MVQNTEARNNPHLNSQLTFDKGKKPHNGVKIVDSINGVEKIGQTYKYN